VGQFAQEVGKSGESSTGQLGLGGAASTSSGLRMSVVLAAAYVLLAMCV